MQQSAFYVFVIEKFKEVVITETGKVAEAICQYGVDNITNEYLLSLITGDNKKVKFLLKNSPDLYRCLNQGYEVLMKMYGLTKLQALRLSACVEIGKRIYSASKVNLTNATCAKEIADYIMNDLRYLAVERFVVIFLNSRNKIIGKKVISQGSLTGTVVHPREVLREAILYNAAAIAICHNHPSGDPNPSKEDKEVTKNVSDACNVCAIPLLDHIVIGDGEYYSFKEEGLM